MTSPGFKIRHAVVSGVAVLMISMSVLTPASAEEEIVDSASASVSSAIKEYEDSFELEPAPGQEGVGSAAGIRIGTCTSSADYVHITAGQASGHAWWNKRGVNCTPSTAIVHIKLQANINGTWRDKTGIRSQTVKDGGG